jgi:hypothetical protein
MYPIVRQTHLVILVTSSSKIAVQATLLEFSSKIKTFSLEIETTHILF